MGNGYFDEVLGLLVVLLPDEVLLELLPPEAFAFIIASNSARLTLPSWFVSALSKLYLALVLAPEEALLFLLSPPAYAAPLARARIDAPSNKDLIAFIVSLRGWAGASGLLPRALASCVPWGAGARILKFSLMHVAAQ